jgi:hypothetical protein
MLNQLLRWVRIGAAFWAQWLATCRAAANLQFHETNALDRGQIICPGDRD